MKTLSFLFAVTVLGACGGSTTDPTPAPVPRPDNAGVDPTHSDSPGPSKPSAPTTPTTPTTAIATVLATGFDNPDNLALDSTSVYFSSGAKLFSCKKSGCGATPTLLATASPFISSIVVAGSEVFLTNGGFVQAVPLAGGVTRLVASMSSDPTHFARGLAYDASTDRLYWADGSSIVSCSKACPTGPTTIASGEPAAAVPVRDGKLYWTITGGPGNNGLLRGCALDACTPHTFVDKQNGLRELVVTKDALHWIADGESTVRTCALPDCTSVAQGPRAAQVGLAADETRTYWSYPAGNWIWACNGASCAQPDEFATNIIGAGSLAVDDDHVYVAASGVSQTSGPADAGAQPAVTGGFVAALPKPH